MFREFFEGLGRFDSHKNRRPQTLGVRVIAYRKGEGVEPDERQTFLQGRAEIVGNLEASTAKQGATLQPLYQLSTPEIMQMHNALEDSASVNNH